MTLNVKTRDNSEMGIYSLGMVARPRDGSTCYSDNSVENRYWSRTNTNTLTRGRTTNPPSSSPHHLHYCHCWLHRNSTYKTCFLSSDTSSWAYTPLYQLTILTALSFTPPDALAAAISATSLMSNIPLCSITSSSSFGTTTPDELILGCKAWTKTCGFSHRLSVRVRRSFMGRSAR